MKDMVGGNFTSGRHRTDQRANLVFARGRGSGSIASTNIGRRRPSRFIIVIRQPGLPDRRIPKADIRSTKFIRRSLMPEGLLDALQDQQVADLLAYLMTLKG